MKFVLLCSTNAYGASKSNADAEKIDIKIS